MDVIDLLRTASPLAIIGVAFALMHQAFRWTWRLAQVEERAGTNTREIARVAQEGLERSEKLETLMACLPRIEVTVNQLIEDRRQGQRRRITTP